MKKITFFFLILCAWTLTQGDVPWNSVWEGVLERFQGTATRWNPLLDERIPRLIVLLFTGAALAVSGTVTQALFQNPLASPSVLGISSGGFLAVIPLFLTQWHTSLPFAVPLAAFIGCLGTLLIVYSLARRDGQIQMSTLILTGIAISTLLLAIQGAVLYAFRDNWQLIQMIAEWEAGSTSDRNWKHVHMLLPLALIGIFGCWTYRKELNLFSLGDEEALNLGVDVPKVRWRLFLSVALLTAGALAAIGIIPFYGLMIPHILRKINGADCIRLIPYSIIYGALILTCTDALLRMFDIHTLSIGNVSALLGGFFFLALLIGVRERQYA